MKTISEKSSQNYFSDGFDSPVKTSLGKLDYTYWPKVLGSEEKVKDTAIAACLEEVMKVTKD
ncbi:hypothetical protein CHS0354_014255 [Potamilus streckersoni]|uniref:Uncharacterized protein n=1 Tax=Potamilus streckersoni TaxID=2493646 RepID=A0AAE0T2J1_9BIVA|nr:hypothetical protein CHS0354_014255 [Potamilus streckersoni]